MNLLRALWGVATVWPALCYKRILLKEIRGRMHLLNAIRTQNETIRLLSKENARLAREKDN